MTVEVSWGFGEIMLRDGEEEKGGQAIGRSGKKAMI